VTKDNTEAHTANKKTFGKSLAIRREMNAGEVIAFDDLESKKPGGMGVPASDFTEVVGRKLKVAKRQWEFLTYEDFA
jgi:N-acetylneuraminate synthase